MPTESGGIWSAILTRITTVRQGFGVLGQQSAVKLAVLGVIAIAVYCIVASPYVTIPILLIVTCVLLWERDGNIRALKFARDHPEYASLGPQQTVQVLKAQASLRQVQLPPGPNTAPPQITAEPIIEVDKKEPDESKNKPEGDRP